MVSDRSLATSLMRKSRPPKASDDIQPKSDFSDVPQSVPGRNAAAIDTCRAFRI